MLHLFLTRANDLLRDERGAAVTDWMFPLLLLMVLGAVLSPQLPGKWDRAALRLPITISIFR